MATTQNTPNGNLEPKDVTNAFLEAVDHTHRRLDEGLDATVLHAELEQSSHNWRLIRTLPTGASHCVPVPSWASRSPTGSVPVSTPPMLTSTTTTCSMT